MLSPLELRQGIGTSSIITVGPSLSPSTTTPSPKSPPSPGTLEEEEEEEATSADQGEYVLFTCICRVSSGASVSSSILISLGSAVNGLPTVYTKYCPAHVVLEEIDFYLDCF